RPTDDPGLGQSVIRLPNVAGYTAYTCKRNDTTMVPQEPLLDECARDVKRGQQVDVQHAFPCLPRHTRQRFVARNAGVVYDDIHAAEFLFDPRGYALARVGRSDVDEQTRSTELCGGDGRI